MVGMHPFQWGLLGLTPLVDLVELCRLLRYAEMGAMMPSQLAGVIFSQKSITMFLEMLPNLLVIDLITMEAFLVIQPVEIRIISLKILRLIFTVINIRRQSVKMASI